MARCVESSARLCAAHTKLGCPRGGCFRIQSLQISVLLTPAAPKGRLPRSFLDGFSSAELPSPRLWPVLQLAPFGPRGIAHGRSSPHKGLLGLGCLARSAARDPRQAANPCPRSRTKRISCSNGPYARKINSRERARKRWGREKLGMDQMSQNLQAIHNPWPRTAEVR